MDEYLDMYSDKFGDGFPMIPIGWGRSENEVIEIIKKCIRENKDVYEMGIVTLDEDILY